MIRRIVAVIIFAAWAGSTSAGPITGANTVTLDGTMWAQVDLFTNLSWNDLTVACPARVCAGELNGYSMDGWTWASLTEISQLFNSYIGTEELGPTPESFLEVGSLWAPAFFADGWRYTLQRPGNYTRIYGFISDTNPTFPTQGLQGRLWNFDEVAFNDVVTTAEGALKSAKAADVGGWFYRSENVPVPAPAEITLFGISLAALGWTRRKKA